MLEIKNLEAGYVENNMILKELDLTVPGNEIVGIIGKNGAGKSTLAKAIMGITKYYDGFIKYNEKIILQNNKHMPVSFLPKIGIKYFIQGGEIFPNLTVEENIKYAGLDLNNKIFTKNLTQLRELFDFLQSSNSSKLKASHLSGGQKHQLALAMLLIDKPDFLILDEPSAGLSPVNREVIYDAIIKMQKELEMSILLIEQNVKYAIDYADSLYLMRLGKLEKLTKEKINIKELFLD